MESFNARLRDSCSTARSSLFSVGWLSFAFLAVTFLNPSFNASFTMTNQGDTSTMVAVGALGLMLWKLIDALVQKDRAAKRELVLQILLVSRFFDIRGFRYCRGGDHLDP